jgi:hypothetical protein
MAAARDATVRAGEYAEAFGGQLGDLLEAADSGLLTSDARPEVFRRAMARGRASAAASAQPELDLEPARQSVSAQVDARFEMTRPAAGQAAS